MEHIDFERLFESAKAALKDFDVKIANKEEEVEELRIERDAVAKIYNAVAPLQGAQRIPTISDASTTPSVELVQTAGISVAIRSILDFYKDENFTASQMRDRLEKHGWDWSDYKNPLSTVHTTLVRLVPDSARDTVQDGKRVFYSTARPKKEIDISDLMKGVGVGGSLFSELSRFGVSTTDPVANVYRAFGIGEKTPEIAPLVADPIFNLCQPAKRLSGPKTPKPGEALKNIDVKE